MDLPATGVGAAQATKHQDHGVPILVSRKSPAGADDLKRLMTDGAYAFLHTPNEKHPDRDSILKHILIY